MVVLSHVLRGVSRLGSLLVDVPRLTLLPKKKNMGRTCCSFLKGHLLGTKVGVVYFVSNQ